MEIYRQWAKLAEDQEALTEALQADEPVQLAQLFGDKEDERM